MQIFLVTIVITNKSWDYKVGDLITIPVYARSSSMALQKFENEHWGSEYPCHSLVSVTQTDGLYYPVGFDKVTKIINHGKPRVKDEITSSVKVEVRYEPGS